MNLSDFQEMIRSHETCNTCSWLRKLTLEEVQWVQSCCVVELERRHPGCVSKNIAALNNSMSAEVEQMRINAAEALGIERNSGAN